MAKFNSVLSNRQSGKVGDIVTSRWRSLKIIRQYVPHIKKAANQTLQLIYRLKMKVASKLAATVRGSLTQVWSIRHKTQTEFSAMVQWILLRMLTTGLMDITKLQSATLGNGHLPLTLPTAITAVAGVKLTLTWNPLLIPPGFPSTTATVNVLVFDSHSLNMVVFNTITLWSTGTVTVTVTPNFASGQTVFAMLQAQNVFTNPLTSNTYTWYSKFAGMVTAIFATLIT
jgi:hypothetical protein